MRDCRKAQLNPLGGTRRELRSFDGERGGWRVGWGQCMIENNMNRGRHPNILSNPKGWQISEMAVCGHICRGGSRDSLDPKRESLECQAQKPQTLQAMWESLKTF